MVDYEDWVYVELKRYSNANNKSPFFISSWDCDPMLVSYPQKILARKELNVEMDFSYKFSEDLDWVKDRLCEYWKKGNSENLSSVNFSLGNNATSSIYLSLLALKKQSKNRFLVITPSYYSVLDTLTDFGKSIYLYHLMDSNDFTLDIEEIHKIVRTQYIEVIIFSDPIYCVGIELNDYVYERLVDLSNEYELTIFVDRTLGGLSWNEVEDIKFNSKKLDLLSKSFDFIFICSEPKAHFLNDLKFSVLIGSQRNVTIIEDLASQVSGGLTKSQIELFNSFYSEQGLTELNELRNANISIIKANYSLLKTSLLTTGFELYPTNSGYFTMLHSKDITLEAVDPKQLTKGLLYDHHILALLGNYFNFFKENGLSLRVNLMKDFRRIIPNLIQGLDEYV